MQTQFTVPPHRSASIIVPCRPGPRWLAIFACMLLLGTAGVATARQDGKARPVLLDVNGPVQALTVYGGHLVAGGDFTQAGNVAVPYLAIWDGTSWSAVGPALDGRVFALAVLRGDLIVGGEFTHAGALEVNHVARWDGTSWSSLGSGTNGAVRALVVQSEVILFAGGAFTAAGGQSAFGVARWVGGSWTALGNGVDGEVHALTIHNGNLVAGGAFRTREPIPYNFYNLARYSNGIWNTPARGLDGPVHALAVYGVGLVMGGAFTFADYVTPASSIAQFLGSEWLSLAIGVGTGVEMGPGEVRALCAEGDALYVGGSFTHAAYLAVNHVARWNGDGWESLGAGLNGPVNALTFFAGGLVAGGEFTASSGHEMQHLAAFDGAAWQALRSTPVQVEDLRAGARAGRVRLSWHLSAAARSELAGVRVERAASAEGPYEERTLEALPPQTDMVFDDAGPAANPSGDPCARAWYRLQLESLDGTRTLAGPIALCTNTDRGRTALHRPYIAGGGDQVVIGYSIGQETSLRLEVYDVRGRLLRVLDRGRCDAGEYLRTWDRRDGSGQRASRGIYFVHLRAAGALATRKLVLAVP